MKKKGDISKSMLRQYFLLIIPGFVIFTIGIIIPMVLAVRYSFTNWDGMAAEKTFIGFDNYIKLLKDPEVKNAWWFTIRFTIGNTILQNIIALLFAVALDSGIKAQKIYRAAFFIPCLISSVIVGFIWLRMYSNVLPAINDMLGTSINFLLFGEADTVLGGLLIANNWQWVGYWMLIYLAGLQSIPGDLYEAAKVDGAGPIKRFFNVTVPMLAPSFTICIVGITTGSLKVYDLLVSSTKGGPGRASTSIIYQTYTTAINGRQFGYGSAMSTSLVLVLLLVAVIQVRGLKKKEVQA
ncbi:carbohydrate ABC transporter permease [Faecalicatena contorta]|uniref:Raffinose/stachyose/melibiose transport system permease protein n=1 Tax=Faecalicatena contorta TaxID=39482 RepID=A0A315ZRJ7_9FIRM|nr:sugar ABC transporter permease [Faecalicatena contorta]PWJ47334.1 raffinose/stachyose/melibiose transport system permease protein [Faecalicatena contorta]SUQ16048.1 raffinose/stachyose/melibiose transport system permease protein [Faecalicatena contorta]